MTMQFQLSVGEKIYGLGERFGNFIKNGQVDFLDSQAILEGLSNNLPDCGYVERRWGNEFGAHLQEHPLLAKLSWIRYLRCISWPCELRDPE